jgi:type III secretory pathway lipoprotein EscJ
MANIFLRLAHLRAIHNLISCKGQVYKHLYNYETQQYCAVLLML